MDIMMIGIDHSLANIDQREKFSFNKAETATALEILSKEQISGSVLLSTCNRTELWVSCSNRTSIQDLMTKISGMDASPLTERSGRQAVAHLFRLACGLESQLTGEDQILTQIRDSHGMARQIGTTDPLLDKVFSKAIWAAKKVKTNVKLSAISPSAARSTVLLMEDIFGTIRDLPCLIIGNGQIGRLLSEEIVIRGGKPTMTMRKHIHGRDSKDSIMPDGCNMIPYEDRTDNIGEYSCVISGTLSPHYTIRRSDIENKVCQGQVFLDLAVPRDIEVTVGEIDGVKLYNMDQISEATATAVAADDPNRNKALAILEEALDELEECLAFEPFRPSVEKITELVIEDVSGRMRSRSAEEAMGKSVEKLLFGLKKHLPKESWEQCFKALEKSACEDTIKS